MDTLKGASRGKELNAAMSATAAMIVAWSHIDESTCNGASSHWDSSRIFSSACLNISVLRAYLSSEVEAAFGPAVLTDTTASQPPEAFIER